MNARKAGSSGAGGEASVEESWEKLSERLARIREDLAELNTATADLARAGAAEGRARVHAEIDELTKRIGALAEEVGARGQGTARFAGEQVGALGRELEDAINRNPIAAALIAVGLGFLIGMASRGRS